MMSGIKKGSPEVISLCSSSDEESKDSEEKTMLPAKNGTDKSIYLSSINRPELTITKIPAKTISSNIKSHSRESSPTVKVERVFQSESSKLKSILLSQIPSKCETTNLNNGKDIKPCSSHILEKLSLKRKADRVCEPPNKKRIVTVSSEIIGASTSNFERQSEVETQNGKVENLLKSYLLNGENPYGEPKTNDKFKRFLHFVQLHAQEDLDAQEEEKLIKVLNTRFNAANPGYVISDAFYSLLDKVMKNISVDSKHMFVYILDLCKELKAHKRQKEKTAVRVENAIITTETTTSKAETATLKAETATSKAETTTSKAETTTSKAETATSKAETATLKAETATLKAESATSKAEIATSKAEIVTSKVESATSKAESATSKAVTETLKAETATLKAETGTSKAESATSKAEIATSKAEIATSKAEIATSKAEIATSKVESETSKAETTTSNVAATSSSKEYLDRRKEKSLRKLEKLLKLLHKKIASLQNRELTLDDMDKEDSYYIREERLKNRFVKVYKLICKEKECSTNAGREIFKKFHYSGTKYEEINKRIENLVNRKKIFPDYTDVLNIVKSVSEDTNLYMTSGKINTIAMDVFADVGQELKRRREIDDEYMIHAYVSNENMFEDPANSDPALKAVLDKSLQDGDRRIQSVIDKYVEKQDNLKENPKEVPDDAPSSGSEEDDDEEEEEEKDEHTDIDCEVSDVLSDDNDQPPNSDTENE